MVAGALLAQAFEGHVRQRRDQNCGSSDTRECTTRRASVNASSTTWCSVCWIIVRRSCARFSQRLRDAAEHGVGPAGAGFDARALARRVALRERLALERGEVRVDVRRRARPCVGSAQTPAGSADDVRAPARRRRRLPTRAQSKRRTRATLDTRWL